MSGFFFLQCMEREEFYVLFNYLFRYGRIYCYYVPIICLDMRKFIAIMFPLFV